MDVKITYKLLKYDKLQQGSKIKTNYQRKDTIW